MTINLDKTELKTDIYEEQKTENTKLRVAKDEEGKRHVRLYDYNNSQYYILSESYAYHRNAFDIFVQEVVYKSNQNPTINFAINYKFEEYIDEYGNLVDSDFSSDLTLKFYVNGDLIDKYTELNFTHEDNTSYYILDLSELDYLGENFTVRIEASSHEGYEQVFQYDFEIDNENQDIKYTDLSNSQDSYEPGIVFEEEVVTSTYYDIVEGAPYQPVYETFDKVVNVSTNPNLVSTNANPLEWIIKVKSGSSTDIDFTEENATAVINDGEYEFELEWEKDEYGNWILVPVKYSLYDQEQDEIFYSDEPEDGYEKLFYIPRELLNEELKMELTLNTKSGELVIILPIKGIENDIRYFETTEEIVNIDETITCYVNGETINSYEDNNYERWCNE